MFSCRFILSIVKEIREELIKRRVTKTRPGEEGPVTQLSEEIHKMDPKPSNSNGSGDRDKKN